MKGTADPPLEWGRGALTLSRRPLSRTAVGLGCSSWLSSLLTDISILWTDKGPSPKVLGAALVAVLDGDPGLSPWAYLLKPAFASPSSQVYLPRSVLLEPMQVLQVYPWKDLFRPATLKKLAIHATGMQPPRQFSCLPLPGARWRAAPDKGIVRYPAKAAFFFAPGRRRRA